MYLFRENPQVQGQKRKAGKSAGWCVEYRYGQEKLRPRDERFWVRGSNNINVIADAGNL